MLDADTRVLTQIRVNCYVRVAVQGKRNVTPVSYPYHDLSHAVQDLQTRRNEAQYKGRRLVLKEYSTKSHNPTGEHYHVEADGSAIV